MKKVIGLIAGILFLLFSIGIARAITEKGLTLSIINDDVVVREFREANKATITIPFDSEYTILLKNNNDRRATARIFIDGAKANPMGDIIIGANDSVTLERFIDKSLSDGKKFKFVPLDNPYVDDPNRKENGLVRVEFRLEWKTIIYLDDPNWEQYWGQPYVVPEDYEWRSLPEVYLTDDSFSTLSNIDNNIVIDNEILYTDTYCSNTSSDSPGATIQGGDSNQEFVYKDIDVLDEIIEVTLQIRGVK